MVPLPFLYRLAILAAVFAALSVWHFSHDPQRWREYGFVFIAGTAGALFGVLNDLLTSTISPAYFVVGKGIPPGAGFTTGVISLGFQAGFVAGALASCAYLYVNNPKPNTPRVSFSFLCLRMLHPAIVACILGLAFGLLVYFVEPQSIVRRVQPLVAPQEARGFVSVWAIHVGLYLGLVIGVVIGTRDISRNRNAALSNPRLERTGARSARLGRTVVGAGRSTAGR